MVPPTLQELASSFRSLGWIRKTAERKKVQSGESWCIRWLTVCHSRYWDYPGRFAWNLCLTSSFLAESSRIASRTRVSQTSRCSEGPSQGSDSPAILKIAGATKPFGGHVFMPDESMRVVYEGRDQVGSSRTYYRRGGKRARINPKGSK